MKERYSWITDKMFDQRLIDIVESEPPSSWIYIPGVYECLAEYYNNQIIDDLQEERDSQAIIAFAVTSEDGDGSTVIMTFDQLKVMFDVSFMTLEDLVRKATWHALPKAEISKDIDEPYMIEAITTTRGELIDMPEFKGW
jgi:hypothetical protein